MQKEKREEEAENAGVGGIKEITRFTGAGKGGRKPAPQENWSLRCTSLFPASGT